MLLAVNRRFRFIRTTGEDQFALRQGNATVRRGARANRSLGERGARRGLVIMAHFIEICQLTGAQCEMVLRLPEAIFSMLQLKLVAIRLVRQQAVLARDVFSVAVRQQQGPPKTTAKA